LTSATFELVYWYLPIDIAQVGKVDTFRATLGTRPKKGLLEFTEGVLSGRERSKDDLPFS
jgi:hypothetical protein